MGQFGSRSSNTRAAPPLCHAARVIQLCFSLSFRCFHTDHGDANRCRSLQFIHYLVLVWCDGNRISFAAFIGTNCHNGATKAAKTIMIYPQGRLNNFKTINHSRGFRKCRLATAWQPEPIRRGTWISVQVFTLKHPVSCLHMSAKFLDPTNFLFPHNQA